MVFLLTVLSPKWNKFIILKLKIVEVPLVSLFTRDNSNGLKRVNNNWASKKFEDFDDGKRHCRNIDRKNKRTKDIIQNYVWKVKSFYFNISQFHIGIMRNLGSEI